MRTPGIIGLCVALLTGGGVAWCQLVYPTYAYRYRITVEVAVNEVVYSGSSVIEVRLSKQAKFAPEVPAVAAEVSGEAIFLDLDNGRNIFATLASGPTGMTSNYPEYIVPKHFKLSYGDRDLKKFPELQGQWELPADFLPTFVTFSDLGDPRTVRIVRPQDFARMFGNGVSLKRVVVTMTSDRVTRTVNGRLPWLPHTGYLSGRLACAPDEPQCLDGGSFSRR